MATSTMNLPLSSAALPDGSSGNAAPGFTMRTGTNANPKRRILTADFDAATDEHLIFNFRMPANYLSGGVVKILWGANAVANSAVFGASLGAVTPADADTPYEHAQAAASTTTTATNATEARRLNETSITLANLDSVAPGDLVTLIVYRDADNGSDTLTVDAEVENIAFEYTS